MLRNAIIKLAAIIYFAGILLIVVAAFAGIAIVAEPMGLIGIALVTGAAWFTCLLYKLVATFIVWLFQPPMTMAEFERFLDDR